jgi:hypothetical protein
MTSATGGAGTAYPSGEHEFIPVLSGNRIAYINTLFADLNLQKGEDTNSGQFQ